MVFQPCPAEDIKNIALDHLKGIYTWEYNLIVKNCEKFAIWCRYRVDYMGDQARNGLIVGGAVGLGLVLLGGAALVGCAVSKKKENKKKQENYVQYRY